VIVKDRKDSFSPANNQFDGNELKLCSLQSKMGSNKPKVVDLDQSHQTRSISRFQVTAADPAI